MGNDQAEALGFLPHSASLEARIGALCGLTGSDIRSGNCDHDVLTAFIIDILDDPAFEAQPISVRTTILLKVTEIYTFTWHSSARRAIGSVQRVFKNILDEPMLDLSAAATAYDLLYFLYWSNAASLDEQAGFGYEVVRLFSDRLAFLRRCEMTVDRPSTRPKKIGYLAQFLTKEPGNPIANCSSVVLGLLADAAANYRPIVYAWMFYDETTCAEHERRGIMVRRITADSPADRILKTKAAIAADQPDVLITDMNTALPTVVFENRSAPVQIFYQFGMPFWPISQFDGVFHVWSSDPEQVSYATKRRFMLEIPFDFEQAGPLPNPERIALERAKFPQNRLIGTYGRLSKVTARFLQTIAEAIAGISDVTVVIGGTGDAAPVKEVLAAIPGGDRFIVVEGFVDGEVWGHLLDIFLDTFPQQGGASCMEMFGKGKPVISLFSRDMPNFIHLRVPSATAEEPSEYAAILRRLLVDPEAYRNACEDVVQWRRSLPTRVDYRNSLFSALEDVISSSRN
jgi:hypothetical protein